MTEKNIFKLTIAASIAYIIFTIAAQLSAASMFSDLFPNQTFWDNFLRSFWFYLMHILFIVFAHLRKRTILLILMLISSPWVLPHVYDQIILLKTPFNLKMIGLFTGLVGISTVIISICFVVMTCRAFLELKQDKKK